MRQSNWTSVFAGLLLTGFCWSAQGAITCSTSDYAGTFGFITTGSFVQLPPAAAILQGPFAQSGTFTSDGQGNLTIQSTASYNGLIQPANVPATYVINPDCTLTVSLNLPPPLGIPSTFQGVLSGNNRQMSLVISSPPGTVIIGNHYKQDTRFCGVGDFSGAYALDLGGSLAGTTPQSGLFHRIGRVVSDGAGNFTATTLANYNGNLTEEDFSGTYSVTGACGLTLNYTYGSGSSAQSITINGPLAGHGEIAMVMLTTQGWAVSGTLKAQLP